MAGVQVYILHFGERQLGIIILYLQEEHYNGREQVDWRLPGDWYPPHH